MQEIGQGFADELFRVWQSEYPETKLVPVNANPAIMAMIGKTVPIGGQMRSDGGRKQGR